MAKGTQLMVLVDTTVWIDFFADRSEPHAAALQGIRSDADYIETKDYLADLIFLPMRQVTFVHAAEIYRSLRKRGVTIRKPIDCMIAAVAIEHDTRLLHNDRDFDYIAKHSKLRAWD